LVPKEKKLMGPEIQKRGPNGENKFSFGKKARKPLKRKRGGVVVWAESGTMEMKDGTSSE